MVLIYSAALKDDSKDLPNTRYTALAAVRGTDGEISGGGRNRIGRREKWPKQSWEEGEIGGKSREEGEKET